MSTKSDQLFLSKLALKMGSTFRELSQMCDQYLQSIEKKSLVQKVNRQIKRRAKYKKKPTHLQPSKNQLSMVQQTENNMTFPEFFKQQKQKIQSQIELNHGELPTPSQQQIKFFIINKWKAMNTNKKSSKKKKISRKNYSQTKSKQIEKDENQIIDLDNQIQAEDQHEIKTQRAFKEKLQPFNNLEKNRRNDAKISNFSINFKEKFNKLVEKSEKLKNKESIEKKALENQCKTQLPPQPQSFLNKEYFNITNQSKQFCQSNENISLQAKKHIQFRKIRLIPDDKTEQKQKEIVQVSQTKEKNNSIQNNENFEEFDALFQPKTPDNLMQNQIKKKYWKQNQKQTIPIQQDTIQTTQGQLGQGDELRLRILSLQQKYKTEKNNQTPFQNTQHKRQLKKTNSILKPIRHG